MSYLITITYGSLFMKTFISLLVFIEKLNEEFRRICKML
jgi:hypothetical protein